MASSLLAHAASAAYTPPPINVPSGFTINNIVPAGFNAKDYATAGIWDRTWQALASVLGGAEPSYSVVDDLGTPGSHASAHPAGNSVKIDALVQAALLDKNSPLHSGAYNGLPHEMMHLRQTPAILASLADREGGAQAFADAVSPYAARKAGTYYDASRNYDGTYSAYTKAAQAKGRDFIFGGQMGKAPVPFPR